MTRYRLSAVAYTGRRGRGRGQSRSVREGLTHSERRLPPTQLATHSPTTQPLHQPTHYYHLPTDPPTSSPTYLPTCTHPGLVSGEAAREVPQQLLRMHLRFREAVQVARDKVVVVEEILRQAGRRMRGEGEGLPASHSLRAPAYQGMTNIDISPVCTTTQKLLPYAPPSSWPRPGPSAPPRCRSRPSPSHAAGRPHASEPVNHHGEEGGDAQAVSMSARKMKLPVGGVWS